MRQAMKVTVIRIYQLALHLLPATLRHKHGAAMASLFAHELEAARVRGRLYEVAACVAGLFDVVQRSTYELVRMGDVQMEGPHMQFPSTRALLRRHAISFTTAFVGLTVVMLYLFASRQLPALTARGAGLSTIAQTVVLAVPFTAAMTIPMAVFIAVLREFTRMGKNGTLTNARHVRDGVRRLVVPVLAAAAGVTVLAFVVTAEVVPRANEQLATVLAGRTIPAGGRSMTIGELREAARNVGPGTEPVVRSQVAEYAVEIQKKLALPAACLALALAGMALAFRIPRGGMTLVIGGSSVLFLAYYGLIVTGETLVDRLVVSPFVGMWAANACVVLVSLLAAWRRHGRLPPDTQRLVAVQAS